MQRRSFLKSSMAAMAASYCSTVAAASDEPPPLIVDTHQHLWDLTKFRLPWLGKQKHLLNQTYHLPEYAAATRGLNVKSVYMEVDVDPRDLVAEAEHVIALSRLANPTVAAVIGCRPEEDDFTAYVDRFRDATEVKGMRRVLHGAQTPAGFCLGKQFVKSIRLLGERGLSFDLGMRPAELSDGAKLAELCPDTQLIVDHCGNADVAAFRTTKTAGAQPSHSVDEWKRGIDLLAARPNVLGKISGIIARLPEGGGAADLAPIANHCLDAFGPDRVVFGSDWPVCLTGGTLRDWVDMLAEIIATRPSAERVKLWSANAIRHYGLKLAKS